jgi:hypothetical protein
MPWVGGGKKMSGGTRANLEKVCMNFRGAAFAVIPKSKWARGTQDGVARSSVRVPRPAGSSLTSLR